MSMSIPLVAMTSQHQAMLQSLAAVNKHTLQASKCRNIGSRGSKSPARIYIMKGLIVFSEQKGASRAFACASRCLRRSWAWCIQSSQGSISPKKHKASVCCYVAVSVSASHNRNLKSSSGMRRHLKQVAAINNWEPHMMVLTAEQLSAKTLDFRQRLAKRKDTLDSLLPEAFAAVREAARRQINMRHFDSQLVSLKTAWKGCTNVTVLFQALCGRAPAKSPGSVKGCGCCRDESRPWKMIQEGQVDICSIPSSEV